MALTEVVRMPGADYQAICDAVRAKTGGTELLKSGEVAAQILGIQGGGGGAFLGNCKLMYGQFTPTETGSFTIHNAFDGTLIYAAVWIADTSVVSKYSSSNIMLESHNVIGDTNREIHYATNGIVTSVTKSAFGLRKEYTSPDLVYESHANWPGQPETYNWIAVCEV